MGAESKICHPDYVVQSDETELKIPPRSEKFFINRQEYDRWEKRCMLPFRKLAGLNKSYQLVDIRDARRFEQNNIKQSINIPVHLVKTKLFLKSKKIILLSDGYEYVSMVKVCKELSEAGFDAHVLEGGLISWLEEVKDARGLVKNEILYSMPPEILHNESQYRSWIIIELTTESSPKLKQNFKTVYTFKNYPKVDGVSDIIREMNTSKQNEQNLSFLVVDAEGKRFPEFEQWRNDVVHELNIKNLFYMAGGIAGFERFSGQQRAILNKREFTLSNPGGCVR